MRFQAILLVVAAQTAQGLLRSALVSPGKAVSVSIEYSGAADAIDELSQERVERDGPALEAVVAALPEVKTACSADELRRFVRASQGLSLIHI